MSQVCILTDSTAQFTNPAFAGRRLVSVIPFQILLNGRSFTDGQDLRAKDLQAPTRIGLPSFSRPVLRPPSPQAFHHRLLSLAQKYSEVVIILLSSELSPAYANACGVAASHQSPLIAHLIDSQTTAAGLGLLVQVAAEAAQDGACGAEINRLVIGSIPRIYTLFCVQHLAYLANAGKLDPAQALVGEMLELTPILIMENGKLVCHQKLQHTHNLGILFQEFISEFTSLKAAAILQGFPPYKQDTRSLREYIQNRFPETTLSELPLGAALAALIGPHSLGLVAMES